MTRSERKRFIQNLRKFTFTKAQLKTLVELSADLNDDEKMTIILLSEPVTWAEINSYRLEGETQTPKWKQESKLAFSDVEEQVPEQ
jgi:hypothetical protein